MPRRSTTSDRGFVKLPQTFHPRNSLINSHFQDTSQNKLSESLHINLICKFIPGRKVFCLLLIRLIICAEARRVSVHTQKRESSGNVCIAYVSTIKLKTLSPHKAWKTWNFGNFGGWRKNSNFFVSLDLNFKASTPLAGKDEGKQNSPSQMHPINSARRQTVRSY